MSYNKSVVSCNKFLTSASPVRIHIPARFSFKAAATYKSVGPYKLTIYILKSKKYLKSTLTSMGDLHTVPCMLLGGSLKENLSDDPKLLEIAIISFILVTVMFDSGVILLEEIFSVLHFRQ